MMEPNLNHSQTESFFSLFPAPGSEYCLVSRIATHLVRIWAESFFHYSVEPPFKFEGLSAETPEYDHVMAERGGADYGAHIFAHFEGDRLVPLGKVPYPDANGEFVLGGHRYVVPMFLRTQEQIRKMVENDNDALKNIFDRRREWKRKPIDIREYVEFYRSIDFGVWSPSEEQRDRDPDESDEDGESDEESDNKNEDGNDDKALENSAIRNPAKLRVLLVGDLIEREIIRSLFWSVQLLADQIRTQVTLVSEGKKLQKILTFLLKTYLEGVVERPVNRLLRQKVGRLVDLYNPLQRICQRNELSFYGPGGVHPESVNAKKPPLRDVNDGDLYKICPVQTPQGHEVGLRLYLARRAMVDIASRTIQAPTSPSAGDSLGDAASLIPFINHDDVPRALMGANMMKQAVALENAEPPLIQTGWEEKLGVRPEVSEEFQVDGCLALGKNLLVGYLPWGLETFEDGIVISEAAASSLTSVHQQVFSLKDELQWHERRDYEMREVTQDNPNLVESQFDEEYERELTAKEQLGALADKLDGEGIIKIGEEVSTNDVLISAVYKRKKVLGKTDAIDALMAAVNLKDPEAPDASIRFPHTYSGKVVDVIDSANPANATLPLADGVNRRVSVRVKFTKPFKLGDKLTGRHGNKGVVVRILPEREMPYLKTNVRCCAEKSCLVEAPHRHLEAIFNPLGVVGRLNLGQIYETSLAKIAENTRKPYVLTPFTDGWSPDRVANELVQNGFSLDGKEQLYVFDGQSERPLRQKSLVGPQYIVRLHHIASEKLHARGKGEPFDYTFRDDQPKEGKKHRGGQRLGEMETWALAGYGAWHLLDDFLAVKSDDRALRKAPDDERFNWKELRRRPRALVNFILAVRGLGLDVKLINSKGANVVQGFLENSRGVEFGQLAIDLAALENPGKDDIGLEYRSLFDRDIFERPWDMGAIKLAQPIVHPLAARYLWEIFHYPRRFKKEAKRGWATDLRDLMTRTNDWPLIEKEETKDHLQYWNVNQLCESLKGSGRSPRDYVLSIVPVVPLAFRSEKTEIDLNFLYRNVIIANSHLIRAKEKKKTYIAPEMIAMMQREYREHLFWAVRRLFFGGRGCKGLLDILMGKEGLLRGHLAGKRVDFSGRAVIVGDPSVPLDEVRLPTNIWSTFFPDEETRDGRELVLLNRQPSLHRYSVQAFYARRHDAGDVICLNPFVCRGFNADFDGDTMAVHVPIKPQAVGEAIKLLPSNNLFSQATGGLVAGFGGDIAIGIIYLSHHPSIASDNEVLLTEEAKIPLAGRDIRETIEIGDIRTTVGRLRLRRVFGAIPIPNRCLCNDKRNGLLLLDAVLYAVANEGADALKRFTGRLSELLNHELKMSGLSLSLQDFARLNGGMEGSIEAESTTDDPGFLWLHRRASAKGNLSAIIGPRKVTRWLDDVVDERSEEIKTGLLDGHTAQEYLASSHGGRSGLVDKGLNTAEAGLLLRQLIYALQDLLIIAEDCGIRDGLDAKPNELQSLTGRFLINGESLAPFDGPAVRMRSPYKCIAGHASGRRGVCQKCYGLDPATGKLPEIGLPVGILAAQSLGERATQITLRTFHTGTKGVDLTALRDVIFNNAPEVQNDTTASQWLDTMAVFFEDDVPKRVHFEVILTGLQLAKSPDDFLVQVTHSRVKDNLLFAAARKGRDDLTGVISRIVAGRLLHNSPRAGPVE